jgi:hypothetical protein
MLSYEPFTTEKSFSKFKDYYLDISKYLFYRYCYFEVYYFSMNI